LAAGEVKRRKSRRENKGDASILLGKTNGQEDADRALVICISTDLFFARALCSNESWEKGGRGARFAMWFKRSCESHRQ
jgi:hypothetical protein